MPLKNAENLSVINLVCQFGNLFDILKYLCNLFRAQHPIVAKIKDSILTAQEPSALTKTGLFQLPQF